LQNIECFLNLLFCKDRILDIIFAVFFVQCQLLLYDSVNLTNLDSGRFSHRRDFFPFYTFKHEMNGNERLQVMSIFEPFFPNNDNIERDYSLLYSFWRAEKNAKTGAASQSLLWNLYRRETAPGSKNISLLFGVFQYQSGKEAEQTKLFYFTVFQTPPPKK